MRRVVASAAPRVTLHAVCVAALVFAVSAAAGPTNATAADSPGFVGVVTVVTEVDRNADQTEVRGTLTTTWVFDGTLEPFSDSDTFMQRASYTAVFNETGRSGVGCVFTDRTWSKSGRATGSRVFRLQVPDGFEEPGGWPYLIYPANYGTTVPEGNVRISQATECGGPEEITTSPWAEVGPYPCGIQFDRGDGRWPLTPDLTTLTGTTGEIPQSGSQCGYGDTMTVTWDLTRNAQSVLRVTKLFVPETDDGLANLLIDGELVVDRGGHLATGGKPVAPGRHVVTEQLPVLRTYTTTISCRDENDVVVASAEGRGPLDVPVAAGQEINCTFVNTAAGKCVTTALAHSLYGELRVGTYETHVPWCFDGVTAQLSGPVATFFTGVGLFDAVLKESIGLYSEFASDREPPAVSGNGTPVVTVETFPQIQTCIDWVTVLTLVPALKVIKLASWTVLSARAKQRILDGAIKKYQRLIAGKYRLGLEFAVNAAIKEGVQKLLNGIVEPSCSPTLEDSVVHAELNANGTYSSHATTGENLFHWDPETITGDEGPP